MRNHIIECLNIGYSKFNSSSHWLPAGMFACETRKKKEALGCHAKSYHEKIIVYITPGKSGYHHIKRSPYGTTGIGDHASEGIKSA